MTIRVYNDIAIAIKASLHHLKYTGRTNNVKKWQGVEAPRPMFEAFDLAWKAPMPQTMGSLEIQVNPNLPWAEDHFKERISGIPYNPPPSHEHWPFGRANNKKFTEETKFTHTYPERFWPKDAKDNGPLPKNQRESLRADPIYPGPMKGIRFAYGDYSDVIKLLHRDPSTRQAYLPIWFPEDTGAVHGGRVPCTLGYLFYMRNGYLHMSYHIRACDYIRHFRDDVYMAVRLAQHTLEALQDGNPEVWGAVELGYITFHADNFHVFAGEEKTL